MSTFLEDPTFWVFIAFVIFVVAVFRPAKEFLFRGLDSRIERIKAEIEEAERLREEAQALVATYQRQHRQALQEAEEIVAKAKADAERHRAEAEAAIEAAFRRQEQQARDKIAQAEAAAIQEVRDVAVEIAMDAAEKLLAERLDGAEGERMIDRAIEELPTKLQ